MTRYISRRELENKAANDDDVYGLADRLIEAVDPEAPPAQAYRDLLRKTVAALTRAERAVAARDVQIDRLKLLSVTDETTGLLNRRGFHIALNRALERARRYGEEGYLLIVDLNGFKQINDTHGHPAGDRVLEATAAFLRNSVRGSDEVARLGGDEFGIILSYTDPAVGIAKARNLESGLNALCVPWAGKVVRVRASVGSQRFKAGDDPIALIERADAKMYARKRSGRIPDLRAYDGGGDASPTPA